MVISVASGKGGTGKTTISANIASVASRLEPLEFLDCDVEEPDAHFYLKPVFTSEREVMIDVPRVDSSCCDSCGKCSEFCRYNALAVLPDEVLVFEDLCHSCGGCAVACPLDCISYTPRRIGVIREGTTENGLPFSQGLLDIAEPRSVPVIAEMKLSLKKDPVYILDCPPGVGCPTVESIKGSDYCIMVTEPSPFGLHDLTLAHETASLMGIEHGVVINRSRGDDQIIESYCKREGLTLLGRIPFSREVAEVCSRGGLLTDLDNRWESEFEAIWQRARDMACQSK